MTLVHLEKTLNEFKEKPNYITDDKRADLYIKHRREEAKKSDDLMFNEEPAEEREPQSLEEALLGE